MKTLAILAVVALSTLAFADDWVCLVDLAAGTTNGPFSIADREEITVGTNRYTITRASPLAGLDAITIAEFSAREEPLQAALRNVWQAIPSNSVVRVPELAFRGIGTNITITAYLRRVALSDLLLYVSEVANVRVSRHKSRYYYQPKDVLIVEPSGAYDQYDTQVYIMSPATYDLFTRGGTSFISFLHLMGVLPKDAEAEVEYQRESGRLILRAPHEVHEAFRRCI